MSNDPDSIVWESESSAAMMNAGTSDVAARAEAAWLRLGPRHSPPRTARKLFHSMGEQAGSAAALIYTAVFVVGELVGTSISQTYS